MKRNILVLIVCLFFFVPFCFSQQETAYHNDDGHFSLVLPDGWVQIPSEVVSAKNAEISGLYKGIAIIKYDAGFEKNEKKHFAHPYILVKIDKNGKLTESQIRGYTASEQFKDRAGETLKNIESSFSGMLKFGAPGEIKYDDKKQMLYYMQEQDVSGVGKVKSVNVTMLGNFGYTDLYFNTLSVRFDEDIAGFNQIVDSFKYDEGYQYNKPQEKK